MTPLATPVAVDRLPGGRRSDTIRGRRGEVGAVEPVSLTLGAVAASLVAKASDKAADQAVKGGVKGLARLVGWLRERLGDEPAGQALARVEDAPDSPSRVRELAGLLDQHSEADDTFRRALEAMVNDLRSAEVTVGPIGQTAWGDQNVQAGAVTNSTISINQRRASGSSEP